MKKTLSIFLILVIALTAVPLTGCGSLGFKLISIGDLLNSEDSELVEISDSLSYLLECDKEDLVCILDSSFSDESKIPAGVDEYPVDIITADKSFVKTNATSITIPKDVKYVDCVIAGDTGSNESIKSVTFSGETVINKSFCNCSALEEINLAGSDKINSSFKKCTALRTVDFPNINIISNSFTECESLESAKLKYVLELNGSFNSCDALKYLELSDVDNINDCFSNCSSLQSVSFQQTLVIKSSFTKCDALQSISLGGVQCISKSFTDCAALASINEPLLLEVIEGSFTNCPKLGSIKMMGAVKKVTDSFKKCPLIQSTGFIRKASIVKYSFEDCAKLSAVVFDGISVLQCPFTNCNALKTLSCTFKECPDITDYSDGDDTAIGTETVTANSEGLVISNSFVSLKGMTSANVAGKIYSIKSSFNNLPQFNTFKYNSLDSLSDSFKNCPKLKNEVITDAEKEKRRKEEEERKKKEELDNEPYGPGESGIKLENNGSKKVTYKLLKMNSESEFEVTLDPGDSTTKYFPSGRYVLVIDRGTFNKSYSDIYTFNSGSVYEIKTGGTKSDFNSKNPLNNL